MLRQFNRLGLPMSELITNTIRPAGQWTDASDTCQLNYDDRLLRRKVLKTTNCISFLVDLAQVQSVNHGDAFELNDGRFVQVIAADEELLEITGDNLVRLAWHIGNRHTPCQIENQRLVIQHDHVLRDMLAHLGAHVHEITAPFTPEGGAYGLGRTFGHSHGEAEHHHHHD